MHKDSFLGNFPLYTEKVLQLYAIQVNSKLILILKIAEHFYYALIDNIFKRYFKTCPYLKHLRQNEFL